MSVNLRTLAVRPCGECRALVPDIEGCKHWTPGVEAAALRHRRVPRRSAEARKAIDEARNWTRFMAGTSQRAVLAMAVQAHPAPLSLASQGRKDLTSAARRLTQNGYLAFGTKRGTYTLTDAGQQAHGRMAKES